MISQILQNFTLAVGLDEIKIIFYFFIVLSLVVVFARNFISYFYSN
jgi:hypothetical protein